MSLSSCEETEVRPWEGEKRVIFSVSLALAKGSPRACIGEGHEAFLTWGNNHWTRRQEPSYILGSAHVLGSVSPLEK